MTLAMRMNRATCRLPRTSRAAILCLGALLGGALGLMAPAASAAPQEPTMISLISFGSLQGDVEMCGCHRGPKGGIARRVSWLADVEKQDPDYVQLDLGNFASVKDAVAETETAFVWKMMEKLQVASTALGPREMTSWKIVRPLVEAGTIPMVSSNVRVRENGQDRAAGDRILYVETEGVRLGIFSLIGPEPFATAKAPEGVQFTLEDPFKVARSIIPEIRGQADVVVLVSQMTVAESDSLLKNVPGIDVALYGYLAEYEDIASRVGGTIVNRTGERGQYAGRLMLTVDPAGKISGFSSANVALAKAMPEDPETAALVEETLAEVKRLQSADRQRNLDDFERRLAEGK